MKCRHRRTVRSARKAVGRIAAVTVAMLSFASTAYAGAWTQAAQEGLAIQQLTLFSSSSYYDRHGDRRAQPTFNKIEYQPYAEWGLTDALTLGGSTYLQHDWQSGNGNTGIADTELFLRARLYQDTAQVLSVQPLLKLPSYFDDNHRTPRGGTSSKDAELSLLYGRNLHWISASDYLDTRLGYRARSGDLHNQYKADLALGLSPARNWQVIPAIRYVQAASLGSATAFSENGAQDSNLLKTEVTLAYHLDQARWVQLSVFDHTAGKQTGAGDGVSIGYAMRF